MFLGSPRVDRPAADRLAGGRHQRPGEFHPAGRRHGAVRHHADHVVRAEDRDRARRDVAARRCGDSFGGAARFVASTITETIFFLMLSPIMWVGHTMFLAGLRARQAGSAGADRRATITRCRGAMPRSSSGRTRWSAGSAILVLAFTVPAAIPYALFIAAGPALVDPACRDHVVALASAALLMRAGIGALPEENAPPAAAAHSSRCRRSRPAALRTA